MKLEATTTFVIGVLEGAQLLSQHTTSKNAKKSLSKARKRDPRAGVYSVGAWKAAMVSVTDASEKQRREMAEAQTMESLGEEAIALAAAAEKKRSRRRKVAAKKTTPKKATPKASAKVAPPAEKAAPKKTSKKSTTTKAPGVIHITKPGNAFREGTTNAQRYELITDGMDVHALHMAHAKAQFPGSIAGLLRVAEERGFLKVSQ